LGSRRDHPIEAGPRLCELAIVQVEVAELLVVADRWILEDRRLQVADPLAARKYLHRAAQEDHVGDDLDEDVDERSYAPSHHDHEDPEPLRAAADEVGEGQGLENETVLEKVAEHQRAATIK